jgi:hypothetical protein
MPHYVFLCLDCRKVFTEILHIAELSCGSPKMHLEAKPYVSTSIASGSREPGRPDAGARNVCVTWLSAAILTRPLT